MDVTHPERLVFPEAGLTKADVVGHYELVAPLMLPYLAGRPITLQRFPNGIGAKGFMQKNASSHFPDSIGRFPVPKQGGGETVYPVIERAEDLVYLANQGTVTFHMWTSSAKRPGRPDWLVIDLDPDEGDLPGVRAAVGVIGEVLAEFDLTGFPLATGSKGFHLWLPLDGTTPIDRVSQVSRALAGLAVLQHPDGLTIEFLKKNRKGRVFVDWLRNGPTATVVVPYSLRPRATASVAVPLRWDEPDRSIPDQWKLGRLGDRLKFEPAVKPQSLPADEILAAALAAGVDLATPHDRFGRGA